MLPQVEFAYNNAVHCETGMLPFVLVYREISKQVGDSVQLPRGYQANVAAGCLAKEF